MAGLEHYMAQYDHEHHSVWNKILHGIGIPLIFAGLILLVLLRWRWGVGCFVGGWVLLFLGHRIEGQQARIFPGTGVFAGWANLGREGNLGYRDRFAQRAECNRAEEAIDIR